jgi:ribonuclease HII
MAKPTRHDRFALEKRLLRRGAQRIAGIDEAGRGPLAGPVVAAAVIFPERYVLEGLPDELSGIDDSKQLVPSERQRLFSALAGDPEILQAYSVISAQTIDRINILRATWRAMLEALQALAVKPDHVLVDGRPAPGLPLPQTAVVKGDSLSHTIAAASIVAKVRRDRLMIELDRQHPGYGFARHKGYGTREHLDALARLGPCGIHRRSFAPLRPGQAELFPKEHCSDPSM